MIFRCGNKPDFYFLVFWEFRHNVHDRLDKLLHMQLFLFFFFSKEKNQVCAFRTERECTGETERAPLRDRSHLSNSNIHCPSSTREALLSLQGARSHTDLVSAQTSHRRSSMCSGDQHRGCATWGEAEKLKTTFKVCPRRQLWLFANRTCHFQRGSCFPDTSPGHLLPLLGLLGFSCVPFYVQLRRREVFRGGPLLGRWHAGSRLDHNSPLSVDPTEGELYLWKEKKICVYFLEITCWKTAQVHASNADLKGLKPNKIYSWLEKNNNDTTL